MKKGVKALETYWVLRKQIFEKRVRLVFDPKARQLLAETGRIARFLPRFLPAGRLARIPNRDALPVLDNQHQLLRSPEPEKFRRKLFRPETGR
jgi:hypothetical protein